MRSTFDRCLPWTGGFRHFNSHLADFYDSFSRYTVASVNNRALDLERLGEFRMTRFVRDPRDLVVSGYFYHKRGAEPWVNVESPTDDDWYFANGVVPEGLKAHGGSFSDYLQQLPTEEGLLAELEFRTAHFESMARWPSADDRILALRYEEIVRDGPATFRELFRFYQQPAPVRFIGTQFARRYSLRAGRRARRDRHVRNPAPGQWREHFTPRVRSAFDARWRTLIEQLGYPTD